MTREFRTSLDKETMQLLQVYADKYHAGDTAITLEIVIRLGIAQLTF